MMSELSKNIVRESVIQQLLGEEWYNCLRDEFYKGYMCKLRETLTKEADVYTIYPSSDKVFSALELTPLSKVRVVMIGQDPYINPGEAHGLAFSTENRSYTPTLRQIEEAVRKEYDIKDWDNNLTRWADQGILLLNSALTVRAGQSNSHKDIGWSEFIKVILKILFETNQDIVYVLWGKSAEQTFQSANDELLSYVKKIIVCEHPVAASYQNRDWENKKCFTKINELIVGPKINW